MTRTQSLEPKRRDSRNIQVCTVPGCTKCGLDTIEPRPRQLRRPFMIQSRPETSAPDDPLLYFYDTRSAVMKSDSAYHGSQARIIVERSSRRESLQTYDKSFKKHQHRARQQEYNEPRQKRRTPKIQDETVVGRDYEWDYHGSDEDSESLPVRFFVTVILLIGNRTSLLN